MRRILIAIAGLVVIAGIVFFPINILNSNKLKTVAKCSMW